MEVVLRVQHSFNAGWHTFTSNEVPGLFLIGESDHFNDLEASIPGTIAALFEAKTGHIPSVRRLDADGSLQFVVKTAENHN